MKLGLSIYEWQVISIGMTVVLFETLQYGFYIKKMLKLDIHSFIKPLDCRNCTAFWVGTIISIITLSPMLFFMNITASLLYDKIITQLNR